MKDEEITNHIHNPYRFFEIEKDKKSLQTFLEGQKFPLYWNERELKLAWAFHGILEQPITAFNKNAQYAVYENNPYITEANNTTLIEALKNYDSNFMKPKFITSNKKHFAVVNIEGEQCTLSQKEINSLLKFGNKITSEPNSSLKIIISLNKAIELVGHTRELNFRILEQINKESSLYAALCAAFFIPNSEQDYFMRDEFRTVFKDEGELVDQANKWLELWVEDDDLKTHLSCFMEQRRGGRDYRDMFLSSHYNKKWSRVLYNENKLPGIHLNALHATGNVTCLLGWEWAHSDLLESRALVKIEAN